MNKLKLKLKLIDNLIQIDAIDFSNIAYLECVIDEKNLINEHFPETFLYFDELKKSTECSGFFLIFTGVSGIADEAGWRKVNICHGKSIISWGFNFDDVFYSFNFEKNNYISEIMIVENLIKKLNDKYVLEPQYVFFPE